MNAVFANPASAPHIDTPQQSQLLLQRIANGWRKRAKVRTDEPTSMYDLSRPDFLEHLLPFNEHARYQRLDDKQKSDVLSAGWIIYNDKTVAIELDVVSPACNEILAERIPGVCDELTKQIVCETLVDEAYHLLLVKTANGVTRRMRGLEALKTGEFKLVQSMQAEQDRHADPELKRLVQLALAVVSEIFISDYLNQLCNDTSIQPMNRATVAAHRHDELAHSRIFSLLTTHFFHALPPAHRVFFASMLPKAIGWFANKDLDLWKRVLSQLDVPGADAMIEDCRDLDRTAVTLIDYSGVVSLAEEVGILATAEGRDAFEAAGVTIRVSAGTAHVVA